MDLTRLYVLAKLSGGYAKSVPPLANSMGMVALPT